MPYQLFGTSLPSVYLRISQNMLPPAANIKPEKDEATILTELFSKPLMHNEFFRSANTSSRTAGKQVALLPYEIAHTCSYEQDDVYSDEARLLQNELSYARSGIDFEMQSDFTRFHRYPETKNMVHSKDVVMPTLWACVKNAFTMLPR